MKNLKKVLAVLLMFVMVFAMAACGSDDGGDDQGQAAESDKAYVQDKGTLVVGITDYPPMDYEENGEWVGLDADLSKAFAEKLGVDIEFVVIEWDNKIMELDNKSIDMVWNGMTPTDEVKKGMEVSNPYCTNGQILVMAKDKIGQYQTEESLKELSFAVEAGSMGQGVAERLECDFTAVQTQADAVMEVAAGTSEAAIVDVLIAAALVGEGTSYEDLAYGLILNEEQDVVGFRKGSDLAAELNQFLKDIYADGTMLEVAEKYSLKDFMIEQK